MNSAENLRNGLLIKQMDGIIGVSVGGGGANELALIMRFARPHPETKDKGPGRYCRVQHGDCSPAHIDERC